MTISATSVNQGARVSFGIADGPMRHVWPVVAHEGEGATAWYADASLGFNDEEKGWIESKGLKDTDIKAVVPKLTRSYRDAEKLIGAKANAVVLPKMDDTKGLDELFGKLGRPESHEKYGLPTSFTEDQKKAVGDKLGALQQIAHKARMTQDQFGTFLTEQLTAARAEEERKTTAYNGDVKLTKDKLEAEFGAKYGEQVARGNLATQKLGLSPESVVALGEAMGVEKATRFLMEVGGLVAQDKGLGLDNKAGESFVTSKAKAQAEISAVSLGQKPEFKKALLDPRHPEHKRVDGQWREWQRIANTKEAAQ